ncbi:MAG: DUF2723 domain-containing protein [Oligoflexia bacterium]|nr:DUF2723 domain-containing protein [Oligoflexia bacterium]
MPQCVSPQCTGERSAAQRSSIPTILLALVMAAFCVALFWPLVASGPQNSDGAELAVAALRGSLVHPPGYPLYSLISSLLVQLNPSSPYEHLARLSVLFQALAVAVLALICAELVGLALGGFLALAWALSPASMLAAVDVEVFALHHLLFCSTCLFALRAVHGQARYAWLTAVFFGLGLSHHHFIVLSSPLVVAAWLSLKARRSLFLLIAVAIPALFYASLFLRFEHRPDLAFATLQTWPDLLGYILRVGYGSFSLFLDEANSGQGVLGDFATQLALYVPVVCVLALVGLWRCWRVCVLGGRAVATMACISLLIAWMLNVPPPREEYLRWVSRFYPSISLPLVLLAAVGLGSVPIAEWQRRAIALLACASVLFALPRSLDEADLRQDNSVQLELQQVLDVPQNSIIILSSDRLVFGMQYSQEVLRLRSDLLVVAEGMLGNRNYARVLAKRLSRLGIELTSVSIGDLVEASISKGFNAYAERGMQFPAKFSTSPYGSLLSLIETK